MDQQPQKLITLSFVGTFCLVTLSSVAEGYLAFSYLTGDLGLRVFAMYHSTVTVILLVSMIVIYRTGHDIKHISISLILIAVTGIFGAMASWLMLVFFAIYSARGVSFIDWLTSLLPEEHEDQSLALYQRLSSGWDDFSDKKRIISFTDAINLGTVEQKREALAKISRYYRREFAPALKAALHDENNSIRVQAATIVAKFEQEYASYYIALERQYKANPSNIEYLLAFARQADAYAYSGFLQEDREEQYRHVAIDAYKKYLEADSKNEDVRFALARLYIYGKEHDKAYEYLKAYLRAPKKPHITKLMWLIDCMHYLGKLDEIRALVEELGIDKTSVESDIPLIIKETLSFWKEGLSEEKLRLSNEV